MFFRRNRRFSREEACLAAGATTDQLEALEEQRLLTPQVDMWPPWEPREPYYDEAQVEVLKRVRCIRRDSSTRVLTA